jgi:hypothetical protein
VARLRETGQLLRERIDAYSPIARATLLHVLSAPDVDRASKIGVFWADPSTRAFAEFLIDLEEEESARALVLGMLNEPRTYPGRSHR